ncbi:MAG TPA: ribosomal protein S18-alanine N-acetyltransferase, partial [Longilinea sp.]|nr:ribosomal protein S18-alanine N-acetyltransferase [Longilinea sp.]
MEPKAARQVQYRRMVLEDVLQVHAIDTASFSLPWPESSFRYELTENKASRCWVAEAVEASGGKQIVGMLCQWLIIDEAHIGTIAVHPEFRHQGIGKHLLATALLAAYQEGVRQVYLEVRRSNVNAQKMYRQFGFEVTNVRPRYYTDNGEDALLMTLMRIVPGEL